MSHIVSEAEIKAPLNQTQHKHIILLLFMSASNNYYCFSLTQKYPQLYSQTHKIGNINFDS